MTIKVKPIKILNPVSHKNDCPGCGEHQSILVVQVTNGGSYCQIRLCSGCRYALAEKLLDICGNCKHWRPWNVFRSHGRCHVNDPKVKYHSRKHHCKEFVRDEEPQLVHL